MKNILSSLIIYVLLIVSCNLEPYAQPSDNLTELPVLDVIVTHDNLVKLQSNKHINLEIPAKFKYKGENFTGGLRAAGARSRDFFRWSYRVRLDEDQFIEDNNVFNLSVQIHDETMLLTTIASALYKKAGFPMFKSKHVFFRINGRDAGLYPMFEKVELEFFKRRGLHLQELYKAGSQLTLSFNEEGHPSLQFDKEYPDDDNFNTLVDLYRAVDITNADNIDEILGQVLDIDLYLKYHAMTTVVNNPDAFENNFFLWKDSPAAPLKILPWDFDLSFHPFKDVGFYGNNAIIKKLLQDEQYFTQYKSEITDIIQNIYTEEFTFAIIDSTANHIREGYNLDPSLGEIYNFEDKVAELKDYISKRRAFYLQELENFTFTD